MKNETRLELSRNLQNLFVVSVSSCVLKKKPPSPSVLSPENFSGTDIFLGLSHEYDMLYQYENLVMTEWRDNKLNNHPVTTHEAKYWPSMIHVHVLGITPNSTLYLAIISRHLSVCFIVKLKPI